MEKIKRKNGTVRYRESYYRGNLKVVGPFFKFRCPFGHHCFINNAKIFGVEEFTEA